MSGHVGDSASSLELLAINWRDPQHPEAGGAEVHLHELLRRCVAAGHRVTQLASGFPGGAAETRLDGVRIVRRGRWFDANWALARAYRRERRASRFDLVIEDINKIPFMTPLYARSPVLAVVPHLFGTTVFREAAWPFAAYVWAHELLLPWVYRQTDFMVISESTRDDLVARGIDAGRIRVVPVGLDHTLYRPDPAVAKCAAPLIVYVGRLRRYKGIEDLVHAMRRVRVRRPDAELRIVGDGPYRCSLERLCREEPGVTVTGWVSAAEKVRILREAWVAVYPSAKEGFGLTVIEANACGTPVVATRVPGLRDAVSEDISGLLVPHADPARLAEAVLRVVEDDTLRARLAVGGLEWARRFSWDRAGELMLETIAWTLARSGGQTRAVAGVRGRVTRDGAP
ncbi:MAG: glycosyltransferase family 4 protein [Candidatus Eiseniibacteriota bacterium]|jgi:glycosyltransferase involved in cell wall biosynthesis